MFVDGYQLVVDLFQTETIIKRIKPTTEKKKTNKKTFDLNFIAHI